MANNFRNNLGISKLIILLLQVSIPYLADVNTRLIDMPKNYKKTLHSFLRVFEYVHIVVTIYVKVLVKVKSGRF